MLWNVDIYDPTTKKTRRVMIEHWISDIISIRKVYPLFEKLFETSSDNFTVSPYHEEEEE